MESITRTSAFVRLARLLLISFIAVASVPACIKPSATRHEVPVPYHLPAQLPPGAERLPLKVGIYYSPAFENYEHYDRIVGETGYATPVGEFSIRQFDSMFAEMFEGVQPVGHRPPYAANDPGSELHAIIEPRIERFEMNAKAMSFAPLFAQVDYQFKLYLPDGTTLATWNISATDVGSPLAPSFTDIISERTKAVVRKASIQFMQEFSDSSDVKEWLAEVRRRESETERLAKAIDTTFDVNAGALASGAAAVLANTKLDGVDVSASLYWQVGLNQVPIEDSSVKSPLIATRLTIKNNRVEPIVFDPSNLRLRTNRFATLTPDSAHTVAQRMLRGGGNGDDGAVAAIFLGPVFGAMASTFAAIDQANLKDEMLRKATDELRREQLDNQTIAPNQSVSGIVYFIALGIDRNLDEPELLVSIADPSQRKSYETTLNMTTGTATGGTLLLAGLKPPESAPQKIAISEPPQQTKAAVDTTTEPLRVGILPPAFLSPTLPSNDDKESGIYSEIRRYIHSKPNFDVSYDYGARYGAGPLDTHAVWQGSFVKKVPDKAKMQAIGEELAVDVLVLAWITGNRANTIIDLYVFEVASGRMSHDTDGLGRAKGLVASTFGPIKRQQARQRAGSSAVASAKREPVQSTEHTQSRRQLLNPTELRVLLTGNTLTAQTSKGIKFHVYYRADGAMYGMLLSGRSKGKRDDGTWNVTDERGHCRQWIKWAGAAEQCFNLFRYGESVIYEQNSGSEGRKGSGVMRAGNPENL